MGRSVSQPPVNPPRPEAPPRTKTSATTSTASASAPKETFARRYKFVWPVILMVNLAVGGKKILLAFVCLFVYFYLIMFWIDICNFGFCCASSNKLELSGD